MASPGHYPKTGISISYTVLAFSCIPLNGGRNVPWILQTRPPLQRNLPLLHLIIQIQHLNSCLRLLIGSGIVVNLCFEVALLDSRIVTDVGLDICIDLFSSFMLKNAISDSCYYMPLCFILMLILWSSCKLRGWHLRISLHFGGTFHSFSDFLEVLPRGECWWWVRTGLGLVMDWSCCLVMFAWVAWSCLLEVLWWLVTWGLAPTDRGIDSSWERERLREITNAWRDFPFDTNVFPEIAA